MRADLRKTEIKRKYQKLMEFYADASSLLIGIYKILSIIFGFFNNFYAYHSISKRIFFFKELEDCNFHIFEKNKQIQELIAKINDNNEKNMTEKVRILKLKNINMVNDVNDDNNIINDISILSRKLNSLSTKRSGQIMNAFNFEKKGNKKYYKSYNKNENTSTNHKSQNSKLEFFKNINISYQSNKNIKSNNKNLIVYNFNIFEIIISQFFGCCLPKNLKLKSNPNEKANEIIFKKMDIILYIRNMILFDIMNKTLIDANKKTIINFLCRPIIAKDKKDDEEFEEFYKNYKENDFAKLYDKIPEFVQKAQKENRENRLIELINEHLNELI